MCHTKLGMTWRQKTHHGNHQGKRQSRYPSSCWPCKKLWKGVAWPGWGNQGVDNIAAREWHQRLQQDCRKQKRTWGLVASHQARRPEICTVQYSTSTNLEERNCHQRVNGTNRSRNVRGFECNVAACCEEENTTPCKVAKEFKQEDKTWQNTSSEA